MEMQGNVLFSSKTVVWETPQDFFDKYNRIYNFDLDVCALPENAKCTTYFTPEMDGLSQPWDGAAWCNPPYGREIADWVRKAHDEAVNNPNTKCVVMLLPARTDTRWFHDYIYKKANVEFIKGRLKFGGSEHNAPFPNMVVIFTK